jgi:uncharacterized membrane protein
MRLTNKSVVFLLILSLVFFAGCKENGQEQQDANSISDAEAKEIAEQEITEENFDEQLDQLEKDIQADTNTLD